MSGGSYVYILRLTVNFNLNHSEIGLLYAIYIIVQRSVLIYYTVLGFLNNPISVLIELLYCPVAHDSISVVNIVRADRKLSGGSYIYILRLTVDFDLDHSEIGLLYSIYIIVQRSVLVYYTVFGIIKNDNTIFIKRIDSVIQQSVCFGYIVITRFNRSQCRSYVIIISAFVFDKTCCYRKFIGNIIDIVIDFYKTVALYLSPGFIKQIPNSLATVTSCFYMAKTSYHVTAVIEIIGFTIDAKEPSVYSFTCPIIADLTVFVYPCALDKNSVFVKCVFILFRTDLLNSGQSIILVTEIIVIFLDFSPAAHEFVVNRIVQFSVQFKQSCSRFTDIIAD